jgi:hypothetical protein
MNGSLALSMLKSIVVYGHPMASVALTASRPKLRFCDVVVALRRHAQATSRGDEALMARFMTFPYLQMHSGHDGAPRLVHV